jgi:hypothetical protein
MHSMELINLKFSHIQSTFRHVSLLATTVVMEFTLEAKTPLYGVWQRQKRRAPNIQQVVVWQRIRYEFYGQGLTRQTVFDNGVLANKMATTEIFRNVDRLFEDFIIIKCTLWFC